MAIAAGEKEGADMRQRVTAVAIALLLLPISAAAGKPPPGAVAVTLTTQNLHWRLSPMPPVRFGPLRRIRTIAVRDTSRYQRIWGFGAAMTDTSAWLLYDELRPARRARAMAELFAGSGIGLRYLSLPVGASDFTATGVPYTYDDMPAGQTDPTLSRFSVAHDRRYIFPALRQALVVNPAILILARPWSAPGWMKANDALDDVDFAGQLLSGDYGAFAHYLVDFVEAFTRAGVPIAALTPENEAHTSSLYPGMDLDEDTFLLRYLAPALRAARIHPRVYGLDGSGFEAGLNMITGPVRSVIAGVAWHCYQGLQQMSVLHDASPTASLVMDECSPRVAYYPTAETVIASLRNYAQAVDLWNLALDPAGGPKQPVPGCDNCQAVVTIDERTHRARLTLDYYQLGQASKFVQRGAIRIYSDRWVSDFPASGSIGVTEGLDNVAVRNPDGTRVLVAYNNSAAPVRFQVAWHRRGFAYRLAPHATATFEWN
ncbi:MAG: hypothetical protein JOZ64_17180 [Solirubrobacterales bacterium]|nr:hypothetical protein [Solirubrobacterales bacterium]